MINLKKIRTVSILQRANKAELSDLLRPEDSKVLMESADLNELVEKIAAKHSEGKHLMFSMGAHVIKFGMGLLVIDLIKRGVVKHIAMNGAGPIHDFELAYFGRTSEYVEKTIEDGSFGMVEETGRILNEAINEGAKRSYGMGYSIGKKIADLNLPNREFSILYHTYRLNVPATVHVAIGTDTIHMHPHCDGAATGATSYEDFKLFAESVTKLEGGTALNVGSAVILPEVFLKALTIARNLGYRVEDITTANLDYINHYRPRENVVNRPTSLGGKGYTIIGRHEQTLPTLHRKLVDKLESR